MRRGIHTWTVMAGLLLAGSAQAQQQLAPRTVEVTRYLNGNFNHVSPSGYVGKNTLDDVDGGFWTGAEGLTVPGTGGVEVGPFGWGESDRDLSLAPFSQAGYPIRERFVSQRAGVRQNHSWRTSVGLEVALGHATNELRVTLSEGGAPVDSLEDLTNLAHQGDTWELFLIDGGGTETQIPKDLNAEGKAFEWKTGGTGQSGSIATIDANALALAFEWIAPESGSVRFLSRPYRQGGSNDDNTVDLTFELFVERGGITESVRSDVLQGADKNGPEIVFRTEVQQDDRIRVVATKSSLRKKASFVYLPRVAFEGRKLTYRYGPALEPAQNTADHVFLDRSVIVQWTQVNESIGLDFVSAFGTPPSAPIDLMLWVPPDNVQSIPVLVDDVKWLVDYDNATRSSLREELLEEARWMRDNFRLVRDRDELTSSEDPGQLGPKASPYIAYGLLLNDGPQSASQPAFGIKPDLLGLLKRSFDITDYEDFYWIEEQASRRVHPVTGLNRELYDPDTDTFSCLDDTAEVSVGQFGLWVDTYKMTGDPIFLDRAYAQGNAASLYGVFPSDPTPGCATVAEFDHEFLYATKGYRVGGGPGTLDPCEVGFPDRMNVPGGLLQAYAECKAFDAGSASPRYPNANFWLSKALRATDRVRDQHHIILPVQNSVPPASCFDDWLANNWHNGMPGIFNDNYGYNATAAAGAIVPLIALGSTNPSVLDAIDTLWSIGTGWPNDCDIMGSGANDILPRWEQCVSRGGKSSGDEPRGWLSFAHLLENGFVPDPEDFPQGSADRVGDQFLRAIWHAMRFQYPGGIWVSDNNGEFQIKSFDNKALLSSGDVVFPAMRAPGSYLGAISYAIRALQHAGLQDREDRIDDLLAVVRSHLIATKDQFRRNYGYQVTVNDPPALDGPAGAEARFRDAILGIVDTLDELLFDAPPQASIDVPSFSPSVPSQDFTFTIEVPTATSTADLTTALNTRTRIYKWAESEPCGSSCCPDPDHWQVSLLWPGSGFQAPTYDLQQQTAQVILPAGAGTGDGDFKFTLVTWDENDRWGHAASMQEAW